MPLYDASQGTPQLNQPVVLVYNGFPVIDTWKGNLPNGASLVSGDQGLALLKNLDSKYYGNKDQLISSFQSTLTNLPQSNYVIGPNGNLMTKEAAANYMPSAQETARGVKPTGQYASGAYETLANGAIVPKGGAASSGTGGSGGGPTPPTSALKKGDTGDAVKQLQDYLVSKGLMTQAQVSTGYGTYGSQTEAAVTALQKSLGVDNASGPGVYGPRTIAAVSGGTPSGTAGNGGTGGSGSGATPGLDGILNNSTLSDDQKAAIRAIYSAVSSNDTNTAARIKDALAAATQYSDPYFKAQTRLALDALDRGLSSKDGDLAYKENSLKSALDELTTSTAASQDQLSFEHAQELKQLAAKYETDLGTTRDNLAASGFTDSSKRARAEQILNDQNMGLVESSNKTYGYQSGNLSRTLAAKTTDTAAQLADFQRQTAEGKLDLLRTTEGKTGTTALTDAGYTGTLGGVGGTIPHTAVTDALQFANGFVF